MSELTVSVIICTRDRPRDLARCLESIAAQSVQPDEVLIVTGSDESFPTQLANDFADLPIAVVECFEHNISSSRNAGLNSSKCEIALFIDDDAIACADWVRLYLVEFESHPKAWAIGGKVFDIRDSPPSVEFARGVVFATGVQIPVIDEFSSPPKSSCANVKGCNFAVRKREIQELGGFDEFFAFAYDESDLMMRIHEAGGMVVHLNGAAVEHAHTPGHYRTSDPLDHDWRVQYASHTMFAIKHANGFERLKSKLVIARRFFKLLMMLTWCTLSGQIRLKTSCKRAREALHGIEEALLMSQLTQPINDEAPSSDSDR